MIKKHIALLLQRVSAMADYLDKKPLPDIMVRPTFHAHYQCQQLHDPSIEAYRLLTMCSFTDKILHRIMLIYRRLPVNVNEAMLQRLQIRPMSISLNMLASQRLRMLNGASESDRGKVSHQRPSLNQNELLSAGPWEGLVMREPTHHLVPPVSLRAA